MNAPEPFVLPPLRLPPRDAATAPFWDAAAEGRLVLQRRHEDGAVVAPALERTPPVLPAEDAAWVEVSGMGRIKRIAIVEGRTPERYVEAEIALDEGAMISANIVGPGAAEAEVGERVRCVFEARGNGQNAPQFIRAAVLKEGD